MAREIVGAYEIQKKIFDPIMLFFSQNFPL